MAGSSAASVDPVSVLASRVVERGARIVGISGAVAAGKSTLAQQLAAALQPHRRVEVISTDGFLHPNAVLEADGLLLRKGFPESYDAPALDRFLRSVRAQEHPAVPLYSHRVYDVVGSRPLEAHDVLLIEGLTVLQHGGGALTHLDLGVYLDADEDVLLEWFTARFHSLTDAARLDPSSFYHQFAGLPSGQAAAFARQVWEAINGPNLHLHILPSRNNADLVLRKGRGHRIEEVATRPRR